jgi:hypothetical protein
MARGHRPQAQAREIEEETIWDELGENHPYHGACRAAQPDWEQECAPLDKEVGWDGHQGLRQAGNHCHLHTHTNKKTLALAWFASVAPLAPLGHS